MVKKKEEFSKKRVVFASIIIIIILLFLIWLSSFNPTSKIIFVPILTTFIYVTLLFVLIILFDKKFSLWLNKKNNKEDLGLAIILFLTIIFFNFLSNLFWAWGNRPSKDFGPIEIWAFPVFFPISIAFLIMIIFFEIKLTKDRKLLRKIYSILNKK